MNMKYFFTSAALIALLTHVANADVVYIDADVTSNTTLADGTALTDGVHYSTSTANDNLWNLRSFANDGTVISSNDTGGEDAPRLRTAATDLVAGATYSVSAYFWGANGATWRGRTSLTDDAGELAGFNTNHFTGSSFAPATFVTSNITGTAGLNPGPLSSADANGFENGGYFDNAVLTEQADRRLFEVQLGTVIADANGSIFVYIDDLGGGGPGNRTWYDGISVQLQAIPEPTSLGLFACMALVTVNRRKR